MGDATRNPSATELALRKPPLPNTQFRNTMLQRVQTVYLLLAGALLALFVALGHVWASATTAVPGLNIATYVIAVATALAALGSVMLYKDRKRQRTVIGYAQILALVLLVPLFLGLFLSTPASDVAASGAVDPFGLYGRYLVALVPLVAYVLLRMARRGVDRDIATVRSMDRLR